MQPQQQQQLRFAEKLDNLLNAAEAQHVVFSSHKSDYEKLDTFLLKVPETTKLEYHVPVGKFAFVEATIVHTNELIVSLGANYFVDRSAIQARQIVKRRIAYVDENIRIKTDEINQLKMRKQLLIKSTRLIDKDGDEVNEEGLKFVEIRELEDDDGNVTYDQNLLFSELENATPPISYSNSSMQRQQGELKQHQEKEKSLGEFELSLLRKFDSLEELEKNATENNKDNSDNESGDEGGEYKEEEEEESDNENENNSDNEEKDEYEVGLLEFSSGLREDDDDDDFNDDFERDFESGDDDFSSDYDDDDYQNRHSNSGKKQQNCEKSIKTRTTKQQISSALKPIATEKKTLVSRFLPDTPNSTTIESNSMVIKERRAGNNLSSTGQQIRTPADIYEHMKSVVEAATVTTLNSTLPTNGIHEQEVNRDSYPSLSISTITSTEFTAPVRAVAAVAKQKKSQESSSSSLKSIFSQEIITEHDFNNDNEDDNLSFNDSDDFEQYLFGRELSTAYYEKRDVLHAEQSKILDLLDDDALERLALREENRNTSLFKAKRFGFGSTENQLDEEIRQYILQQRREAEISLRDEASAASGATIEENNSQASNRPTKVDVNGKPRFKPTIPIVKSATKKSDLTETSTTETKSPSSISQQASLVSTTTPTLTTSVHPQPLLTRKKSVTFSDELLLGPTGSENSNNLDFNLKSGAVPEKSALKSTFTGTQKNKAKTAIAVTATATTVTTEILTTVGDVRKQLEDPLVRKISKFKAARQQQQPGNFSNADGYQDEKSKGSEDASGFVTGAIRKQLLDDVSETNNFAQSSQLPPQPQKFKTAQLLAKFGGEILDNKENGVREEAKESSENHEEGVSDLYSTLPDLKEFTEDAVPNDSRREKTAKSSGKNFKEQTAPLLSKGIEASIDFMVRHAKKIKPPSATSALISASTKTATLSEAAKNKNGNTSGSIMSPFSAPIEVALDPSEKVEEIYRPPATVEGGENEYEVRHRPVADVIFERNYSGGAASASGNDSGVAKEGVVKKKSLFKLMREVIAGSDELMVYTIVVHLHAKDDAEAIAKLHSKLIEASQVYSKDTETISWFVMQDHLDKRAFTIVERYEHESSQQYHLNNPYWKTFDPYVIPLLDKPMDLRRFNELDSPVV
ncbi:hypothetical protein HK100_000896 [Physocladia obscura]|uniref:Uncharacterized protein n=1 Tax=Physocladia obscura TaxID=109957 RepID=A0AAD5SXL4_9FUNG|nr:hypothetical protein HK100_000896 [Physocladia obscura]